MPKPHIPLEQIRAEVEACRKCPLADGRTQTVFGVGNPAARVLIVGEAPGKNEDLQGEPFVGAAGKFLNELLAVAGLCREDVFIANVLKCRPPGNRDPQDDERAACIDYLRSQVAFVKPKVIVCLGRIAAGVILGRGVRMMKEHGVCVKVKNFYIMPTFHPAALLHNPDYVQYAKHDFQVLKGTLHGLELS